MKKYFLTGLITLLPLAATVAIVMFVVNFLTKPFMGIVTEPLSSLPISSEEVVRTISQILILITLFLITIGIGLLAQRFFFKTLLKWGDWMLCKIPFINKVYTTTKEIFKTLFSQEKKSFQQVVMFPFPRPGCYVLGLVSRDAPRTCSEASGQEMVSIFVPATPNPTTGYLILRPRSELIYLKMHSEDALKYVISCGVISPAPLMEKTE